MNEKEMFPLSGNTSFSILKKRHEEPGDSNKGSWRRFFKDCEKIR